MGRLASNFRLPVASFEVAEADAPEARRLLEVRASKNDLKERVRRTGHSNSGSSDAGLYSRRRNGAEGYAAGNSASRTAAPGSATAVCGSAIRHVRAFQYGHFSGPRMGRSYIVR